MDGVISFDILKEKISSTYPKESQFLHNLLAVLDNEHLLEDCFFNKNSFDYDQERWSKNTEFFGAYCRSNENKYEKQHKLSMIKVTVLGLGGVGSNVLLNLAALGVLNIKIIDFDVVSLSNLNRQVLYNELDIGNYKCDIAKTKILDFLPEANIEQFNKKIESEHDIEKIIYDQDFVIAAADVPRDLILDWVNKACVKFKIPYICGGLDSMWATYYSIIPGVSGCMECWKHNASKQNYLYQDIVREDDFYAVVSSNVAIMPLISIVSGLISSEFLKIVTGIADPQALGKLCAFDFKTASITVQELWNKEPECPICQGC